jgi:hypothetical protein
MLCFFRVMSDSLRPLVAQARDDSTCCWYGLFAVVNIRRNRSILVNIAGRHLVPGSTCEDIEFSPSLVLQSQK